MEVLVCKCVEIHYKICLSMFFLHFIQYRIIFQKVKVSSQMIALIGSIATMIGYLIVTDFQTIPYDACTEYSPFHNPSLIEYYENVSNNSVILQEYNYNANSSIGKLNTIKLSSSVINNMELLNHSLKLDLELSLNCQQNNHCQCIISHPVCFNFNFAIDKDQNIVPTSNHNGLLEYYKCSSKINEEILITACVTLVTPRIMKEDDIAEIETISMLPKDVYFIARNNCNEANVSGHQCHWIPSSIITKKECEDCQPICRSVSQTFTFAQFLIGNGVLVFASSLQYVPITSLLMNQSPQRLQVAYPHIYPMHVHSL